MARAVVMHRSKKMKSVLENNRVEGEEHFIELFKKEYPKDWERINKVYEEHVKKNQGKKNPMPEPNKYLINAYNTYKDKI